MAIVSLGTFNLEVGVQEEDIPDIDLKTRTISIYAFKYDCGR